jgi:hypothetical protein
MGKGMQAGIIKRRRAIRCRMTVHLNLNSRAGGLCGVVLGLFLCGCVSASHTLQVEERISKGEETIGVILVPTATNATSERMIRVAVRGQVKNLAEYELAEGTTVLQAVMAAGGFTDYAWMRGVHVIDASGKVYRFDRHQKKRMGKLPLIWYGAPNAAQDFVLRNGMTVFVPLQC